VAIPFAPRTLRELCARHGGEVLGDGAVSVRRLAPLEVAGPMDLTPVLSARFRVEAERAYARGAILFADPKIADALRGLAVWVHPFAHWAMAQILRYADVPNTPPQHGRDCEVHPTAVVLARVVLGNRVQIGPYSVVGQSGFGFARGPQGEMFAIPHAGGVFIDDDVTIAAHCTIDAGTLAPTRIGEGVHIDSHVHIGHNCHIGARTMIAAQAGLAGSVVVGRSVLIGGQAGLADHIAVGDYARIAAKSGVIGDVPEHATVAGYPAVPRERWLRGVASMYRDVELSGETDAIAGEPV
jgi:UDP-3-O-[3-hydroxymyristoyl] glucosamine N-acyltransferase